MGCKSARFDILDHQQGHQRKSNFMDLTHASGFLLLTCHGTYCKIQLVNWRGQISPMADLRLATLFMLRGIPDDFGSHFGLKCSSFTKMNVGTSCRSAATPIGFEGYKSVVVGNTLLERSLYNEHGRIERNTHSRMIGCIIVFLCLAGVASSYYCAQLWEAYGVLSNHLDP